MLANSTKKLVRIYQMIRYIYCINLIEIWKNGFSRRTCIPSLVNVALIVSLIQALKYRTEGHDYIASAVDADLFTHKV